MKVEIKANKVIYDYTPEQALKIKNDLTLENPQYKQAVRFSKYAVTKIPKHLYFYTQLKNCLIVPRGYNIPFEYKIISDETREVTVLYTPFKLELRDKQKEAVLSYLEDIEKGAIVLKTGMGKSILGLYLAYTLRQKCLVLVHKDDLVDGWTKDCKLCFGDKIEVGIYKAKKKIIGRQITIATIQTVSRMSHEEIAKFQSNFGMVIIDECHHIASSSFDLIHQFESAYKIGLTATPERADGLTKLFEFHLGGYAYIQKGESEDILPVKVIVKKLPTIDPQFYLVKRGNKYELANELELQKGKDLTELRELSYNQRPKLHYFNVDSKIVGDKVFCKEVISDILTEYKNGRSIICFFSQKKHIDLWNDLLVEKGVKSSHLLKYYGDSTQSKEQMKQLAESKVAKITLATYSIATEGTNVKSWEVAFLISSINNGKNCEQAIGRVRRQSEDKIDVALVYDYSLPSAYSISSHFKTRLQRYKQLNLDVVDDKGKSLLKKSNKNSIFV